MASRCVSFAGSTVAIVWSGPSSQRIVDFLFASLPDSSPADAQITLRLVQEEAGGELSLFEDDTLAERTPSPGAMAERLLGLVTFHLARASSGGLLLHAAALRRNGRALMFPGASGAGKSTVTAGLVQHGFEYLTDELVFVPEQSYAITAFARPLSLKRDVRPLVEPYFDFTSGSPTVVSSDHCDLVSTAVLGRRAEAGAVPLQAIVFPQYARGHDFSLRRLSKAVAALSLMKSFVNARSLPLHGFPQLAQLLRRVPAFVLQYGAFSQLDRLVSRLDHPRAARSPKVDEAVT